MQQLQYSWKVEKWIRKSNRFDYFGCWPRWLRHLSPVFSMFSVCRTVRFSDCGQSCWGSDETYAEDKEVVARAARAQLRDVSLHCTTSQLSCQPRTYKQGENSPYWLHYNTVMCCLTTIILKYNGNMQQNPLPPFGHIWDVEEGGNINLCAVVLYTIIMVHNGVSSSYRSMDWIGLWSCLV